jgi:hypothetical protein
MCFRDFDGQYHRTLKEGDRARFEIVRDAANVEKVFIEFWVAHKN